MGRKSEGVSFLEILFPKNFYLVAQLLLLSSSRLTFPVTDFFLYRL